DVQNFLRACLSCNVIQGYGQTETSGGCTLQSIDDISSGNIGIPLPGIDVRLRSIPEMGYNVTDSPCPRGELMICSESVFKCYYNEPERTAETMDGEWLATGDIVAVNPDGTISILERIKNIFKSGLNIWIEPEALETIYNTHSLVDSSFVYSNDEETELVAVIVPDPEHFVSWAQAIIGNKQVSINSICTNEKVVGCMIEQLKLHAVKNNIIKAGIISLVHLEPAPFSKVNPEFITPSFKIRRHLVTSHYKPIFDAMFKRLGTSNRPQFGVSDQHAED
ncbi:medium-chain fatty acid-CoA ligase faa2, partial [Coemansia erecta]